MNPLSQLKHRSPKLAALFQRKPGKEPIISVSARFQHHSGIHKSIVYCGSVGLPQTLYALADSPIGLAAWMLDHDAAGMALMSRVFDGKPEGLTRDDILDNVTFYWFTNTAVSSARLYWESKLAFFAPKGVVIPTAVSAFPDELYQAPRSWAEKAYPKLIHYNKVDKGCHFAAWEQPELFVNEMRAAFKSLR